MKLPHSSRGARQLGNALHAAGFKVDRCHVHTAEAKPCRQCARVFSLAEGQRSTQARLERERIHAEYLRQNPGERAKYHRKV